MLKIFEKNVLKHYPNLHADYPTPEDTVTHTPFNCLPSQVSPERKKESALLCMLCVYSDMYMYRYIHVQIVD